jgi:hypothetical protein
MARSCKKHNAQFFVIECICSDIKVHKERLIIRKRNIEGWPELSWNDVLDVKARYETWEDNGLILDSIDNFQANADKLMKYLRN